MAKALQTVSIDEIKRRYSPGEGRHWFDPGTLRFFSCRLPSQGYEGANTHECGYSGPCTTCPQCVAPTKPGRVYFVTSEQQRGIRMYGQQETRYPRLYSVRVLKGPGDIDTVGDFQEYGTRGAADRRARYLAEHGTEGEEHGKLCNTRHCAAECNCWISGGAK